MTRFVLATALFLALVPNCTTQAQTASHAPTPALTKWRMAEQSASSGSITGKTLPALQRGIPPGTQAITPCTLGSSPNIFGVAFGPRTNLFADPNVNSVMMVYRAASSTDGRLGYSYSVNGGTSFTNNSSLYLPSATAGLSPARFPQGSIYNPTGNTSATNTQASFFAPSLANLVSSGWGGLVHGAKPLTAGTFVATQENRNSFLIPDGGALNPADNSYWISSGLYDLNGAYKDSILLGKGVWTSGQYQYTYSNLYFPVQPDPGGTRRFESTNIAWGYNGTGYLGIICHESFNAVSASNYYPVIFKTLDSGMTWNRIAAIDMYSFSGFFQTPTAYSTGYDLDMAVDANNNLHLFAAVLPVGSSPFTVSDTPGQWGMFDIHTIDGGTTWNAIRVARPQAFRGEWSDTQVLYEDNRPQITKTWNGNRLFYVWFDSDTAGTGARFNNYPNTIVAGLNINTGLMMRDTNSTVGSAYSDLCVFGNVSPYTLLNSGTGCHKIPVSIADWGLGNFNSVTTNVYLSGIEFCNSQFNTNPVVVPLTNLSLWSANINGPSSGCQSSTGTYSISPLTGATQYVWTVPAGTSILSGQGDTTITVQYGAASGIINVKAYDNGVLIGSVNKPVTSQPINIGLSANVTSICNGGSGATLTASGGSTYSWSPTTGLSSSTGASVLANPTSSTIYTVTGTAANGCTNSRSISITVLTAPTVSISALDTTAFCLGDSVALLARSTNAITYKWSRNGTTILNAVDTLYTVKQTGNYRAVVTSANGCTAQSSIITVTVFTPSQTSISANPSTQFCDSGTVALTATGASTYTWSDSITQGTPFSILATDTFTVIGTDANGCLDTATATIIVSPSPLVNASSAVTICRGNSTNLRATGATTYSWSPTNGLGGNTTGDSIIASPITTTLYTVTGTDSLGCSNTDTVTVLVNPKPIVNVSGNTIICPGGSTTLTASGAANYSWIPITGLSAGTGVSVTASPDSTSSYTVTGTAGNGCTNSTSVTIQVRNRPSIGIIASPGLQICSGDSVTLNGTGGVSYTWSGNISNGSAFPIDTGSTFTVTGSDLNGCTNTASVTISTLALPVVSAGSSVTLCRGNSAVLNASGALTYNWAPTSGLGGISTGNSVTASPIVTTTYTVTGTDSSGCDASDTVTVFINPRPTINITGNDTICPGSSSSLTASGAASYSWSPSSGLNNTSTAGVSATPDSSILYTVTGTSGTGCTSSSTFQLYVYGRPQIGINAFPAFEFCGPDTITLSGTGGTSYAWSGGISNGSPFFLDTTTTFTVTGTDANGCSGTSTIVAGVNDLPVISIQGPTSLCIGDSILLSATGATTYTWHPATGLSSDTGSVVKASPANGVTYTITGNNGCTDSTTFSLGVNSLPQVNAGPDKSLCLGKNVTLTASGASSYSWAPSSGLNTTTSTSVIASPSATTNYIVSGTDANGCLNTDSVLVTVQSLPVIGYSASPSTQLCGSGSVTLVGTGGVSYSWTGGATNGQPTQVNTTTTFTVTGTDVNGCTNTANALISVNSLPNVVINGTQTICINDSTTLTATGASNYSWSPSTGLSTTSGSVVKASPAVTTTYTVIGNNGCIDTTLVTVSVRTRPNIVITGSTSICEGKSASLSASGGTLFQWSPSNGLNRTDSAVVIASPSVTTTYSIISTGSNGCTSTSNFTLSVNSAPTVSAIGDTTICRGRSATLSASGAGTYQWSPPGGLNANNLAVVIASPNATTSYSVIGTNANGCTGTDTVIVSINQPPPVNLGTDKAVCLGNSTTLSATGALNYQWFPATGLNTTTGQNVTASPSSTTNYIVTGTDGNGCSQTDTVKVNVNPLPTVNAGPSSSICLGGSVNLTASGADSVFSWSPATGLSSTTGSNILASPISTTTYTVTGTNVTGCTNTSVFTLTVNPLPVVSAGADRFICVGETTTLNATGASTYVWTPSAGLSSGTGSSVLSSPTSNQAYTVTGTGTNGCTNKDTVLITVYSLPQVSAGSDKSICEGGNTTLTATGAQNYQWSPAIGLSSTISPTVTASPGSTTTFFVVGTDGNGCTKRDTVNVTVNPLPTIIAGPGTSICPGSSVTLSASGADSVYTWSPTTGLSTSTGSNVTASPASTTTYTVTGTNVTGCTNTFSFTVTIRALPNISAGNDKFTCQGDTVTINAFGGISFNWSPSTGLSATSGSTVQAFPLVSSTYIVTGTGTNGCSATDTVNVTVWNLPSVQTGPDLSICRGDTVSLTASGASTYTWSPSLGLGSTTGSSVLAFPNSTRNYIVTGRDSNNCRGRDTITVQVFTLPPVNTGNDVAICIGDSVSLSSTGAVNYSWSPAIGLNSTSGNPVMASPSSTTTYQVTGVDLNGCIDTSQITVSVNLLPVVTASAIPNDTLCANELISLTGSGAVTYQWSSAVQNGTPFLVGPGGTYSVIGTDTNGCTAHDSILVIGLDAPSPTTISGTTVVIAGNTYLYFNDNPSTSTLTWAASDGIILSGQGTDTVTIQWDTTSTHTLMLVQSEPTGCSDTTTITIITNSGTGLVETPANGFLLYPNPATTAIQLGFADEKSRLIQVSDIRGRRVLEQRIQSSKAQLDVPPDVQSGMYLIRVLDGNKIEFVKRLMIERGGN